MRSWFVIFGAIFLFSGCATPRLYPICFYNEPPTTRVSHEYFPKMKSTLQAALGKARSIEVIETPDGRWFVAWATEYENSSAAKVWPRIGCVGSALTSSGVLAEMACVEYLREFVKNKNYFTFGNAKDAGGFDIWHESPTGNHIVRCHSLFEESNNADIN